MSSIDKGKILAALREAYPRATVVWQGDAHRPTIWITDKTLGDRCVILNLDMPEMSLEELMENIVKSLESAPWP